MQDFTHRPESVEQLLQTQQHPHLACDKMCVRHRLLKELFVRFPSPSAIYYGIPLIAVIGKCEEYSYAGHKRVINAHNVLNIENINRLSSIQIFS